jgi:hypothetical protein
MRPVTSACALMVGELRRGVDVGDVFDIGGRIDRIEQPAALEIVGDDLRHAGADLAIPRRSRHEIRDRDRQRGEVAFGNDDPLLAEGTTRGASQHAERSHSGNDLPATGTQRHFTQSVFAVFVGHVGTRSVSRFRPPSATFPNLLLRSFAR